jgi:HAE1 family hydrophobic/amphiphilic exporter-1
MWLTRLAITRPVTILMLVVALIILGLKSRDRLPVDLYPDIEFPMLFITTVYTGTGPEEIETLLTKPIEDEVSTISGLRKLSSTSSEGVSSVRMEFEIGTDIDGVTADVRSKLDAIRSMLPQDAKAPIVRKMDVGAIPVISLSVASDRRASQEVRQIADDILKDRLSQINGVAAVSVSGGDIREVRVEVDKHRLEAYRLNIAQVVSALKAENLNLPSGSIDEARQTSAIRVMGEFTHPDQILAVRIPNSNGAEVRIADVAQVRDTITKATSFTRVDESPSVAISVQKQTDANTVKVVDGVRKELERLTGESFAVEGHATAHGAAKSGTASILPADIKVTVAMDQSTFIRDTLHDVYQSLTEGAFLAVLIVFLFLHSLRGTVIVALAIPTSMIATFSVMDALGFSINMMSMLGLSLSVGILVDDSIVVLENIHRHLQMGKSPREAAIAGRSEIGLAAMTITLVDVVVFVPIAFMGGIVGQFFKQFGLVVATATLFSLFVSFTLTPMLASRWLKSHADEEAAEEHEHEHPGLFRRFVLAWERLYGRIDGTYRRVLDWALDHRIVVIALGLMTLLASVAILMPKPLLKLLLPALPKLLLGLVLIGAIWAVVRALHGWVRVVVAVPALVGSIIVAVGAAKVANAGTPMITVLMIILALAIVAFGLSVPYRAERTRLNAVVRPLSFVVAGLLFVCLFIPAAFTFEFSPKVDRRQFSIKVEQDVGTSLEVTNRTTAMIEAELFTPALFPEMKTVFTTVGSAGSGRFGGAGSASGDTAEMSIELLDRDDPKLLGLARVAGFKATLVRARLLPSPARSTDDVIRLVNERYKNLSGVKVTASMPAGNGPGGAPVSIEVSGTAFDRIQQAAERVADVVRAAPGTYAVELSTREGRPEVQALIDRDRAAQYGISVAQIASALRTSLEGDTSTKYREGGKEYDIHVFLPETQRALTAQLPNMVVGMAEGGRPIYLYEVVRLTSAAGPTKLERTNRQKSVTITGQLMEGYAVGNVKQVIDPGIATLSLPGVTVNWSGQAEEMQRSFQEMTSTLVLSIALVFMLMAALFESLLSPLIIVLAVPQAMAGALFALSITHKSLSIVTMIGIIMLVGLVTKNAILLVDYTNSLRKEKGMDRRKALKEAGPTRLRPILMTTLAMIFGMLPTALALSKGAEMRQPMAIAVIGGLMLSMFLTLLMVPVFYELVDSVGERFAHMKAALIAKARL